MSISEPTKKKMIASNQKTYPTNKDWDYQIELYDSPGIVTDGKQSVLVGKNFAPHGGLIFKNITNQGFRMAYDIGIVGIYVFPNQIAREKGFTTKYLVLGPPDFTQLDNDYKILDPFKEYNPFIQSKAPKLLSFFPTPMAFSPTGFDPLGFNMNTYASDIESEVNVKYITTESLWGKDTGNLIVEQKFLFTRYTSEPAHEPTGGLKAARLHPIIRLHFKKPRLDYVESFRIDYRLYFNLDCWTALDSVDAISLPKLKRHRTKDKTGQAAGVFKDSNADKGYGELLFKDSLRPAEVVFQSAEKPLVAEIIAEGLNPKFSDRWYNLHWWGAGPSWVAGSAPGSFHAIHIHWRWGKENQRKFDNAGPDPEHEGEPPFVGEGIEGELTDPNIARQTLRFAVVKNSDLFYNNNTSKLPDYTYNYDAFRLRNENFGDFFKTINLPYSRNESSPKKISPPAILNVNKNGDDLVLFYSVEIKLSESKFVDNILDCSAFIHGLFFAHEPEKDSVTDVMVGALGPYKSNPRNPKANQWTRNPDL